MMMMKTLVLREEEYSVSLNSAQFPVFYTECHKKTLIVLLIFISISLLIILIFYPKLAGLQIVLNLLVCHYHTCMYTTVHGVSSKCNGMVAVCNKLKKKTISSKLFNFSLKSSVQLLLSFLPQLSDLPYWQCCGLHGLILKKTCLQRSLVV